MSRVTRMMLAVVVVFGLRPGTFGQQVADPDFDTKVDHPAFTDRHPAVLFDEAHKNYHTAAGRYKPFAALITSDGYAITANRNAFSTGALKRYDVLIIANAQGAAMMKDPAAADPAFDASECDAVRTWVRGGGGLLLVADIHPWGSSAASLGERLGVEMGKSTTLDPVNTGRGSVMTTVFSRDNGLLGDHPILQGRDVSERIDRVFTFTGQSLKGPSDSVSLLKLSDTATDQPAAGSGGRSGSAFGRAQGVAFTLGKGRVVVLGEAAMLSAQLSGANRAPMGMNATGCDNRQLALNIMHWLTSSSVRTGGREGG